MKRRLVLRRIAEKEFDESIAWYEERRSGLGQEFRTTIEKLFQHIAETPERYRKVRGEVRRALVLRRFPFVIHFLIEKECIVILSVFHVKRDPKQLKRRQ